MKKFLLSGFLLATGLGLAQNVNIPDANFKKILLNANYPKIDKDGDGEISVEEAESFTGRLDLSYDKISDLTGLEAFTNITSLWFDYNEGAITSLDLSANTKLTNLTFEGSYIQSVNLSQNTALEDITANINSLTELDLSNLTALRILNCSENQLTELDLSNNTALEQLSCYTNKLTALNTTQNTALKDITAYANQIADIDLSKNTALNNIDFENNKLTDVDLSANASLHKILLNNNKLTSLNIAFGPYQDVYKLNVTGNPDLTCIQITPGQSPRDTWKKDDTASYNENCNAPTCTEVNIPDAELKAKLLAHYPKIDTNDDGMICVEEAEAVTGRLDISDKKINDLTGLEAFVNITDLVFVYNSGKALDLDLTPFTKLEKLNVESSNISSLNVSQNNKLEILQCNINNLTTLDVSNLTALRILNCSENKITALDLSNNTALEQLSCAINELTELNTTQNTALKDISAYQNKITSIDLSKNTALNNIDFESNKLMDVDLSANASLHKILLNNNKLTSLNIAFGPYQDVYTLNVTGNPDLTCIQITPGESPRDTWKKDDTASYSENCNAPTCTEVNIPDAELKAKLLAHYPKIDTNDDGIICVAEAEAVTGRLDISDKKINDLTGLEAFVNITDLVFVYNNGEALDLDLTPFTKLEKLNVESSNISSLDVSQNDKLEILQCNINNLTTLDVSNLTALRILNCGENQLTELDLSNNTALEQLSCYINELTELNTAQNTELHDISAYNNKIASIDLSNNTQLTQIDFENNKLMDVDLSANSSLIKILLNKNELTALNIAFGPYQDVYEMNVTDNPNLTCIQITPGESPRDTWKKDDTASYNENCNMSVSDFGTLELNIYPNPVRDIFTVNSNEPVKTITIFDINGSKVMEKNNVSQVNISSLKPGAYVVHVALSSQTVVKKIIKQ